MGRVSDCLPHNSFCVLGFRMDGEGLREGVEEIWEGIKGLVGFRLKGGGCGRWFGSFFSHLLFFLLLFAVVTEGG